MPNLLQQAWTKLGFGDKPAAPPIAVDKKSIGRNITRLQLERIVQDVTKWRESIIEAELAYYPMRVKMQRMFVDTVLNGHVFACMERRKDLTLLRDFIVCNQDGTENDEWTTFFKSPWFTLWISYGLDALAYGYQLVTQGDLENNSFPHLTIVPRQNISPDRLVVSSLPYQTTGLAFLDDEFKDWCTYFSTPTENKASDCGYGYLYRVAYYEIILRGLTGSNAQYVETFGMPFVHGQTNKTEEWERAELLDIVEGMASSHAAVTDVEDLISFIESDNMGSGYNSFDNLEQRCEKKISKIILGHADALDSVPGKLGSGQGDNNPVERALKAKKTKDGAYIEAAFNFELLPKLRNLGLNIPVGAVGRFKNDEEEEEFRKREDESNKVAAELMKLISDAGGEPDWDWFSDRTGLKIEKKEVEEVVPPDEDVEESTTISTKIQNKLDSMYGAHR